MSIRAIVRPILLALLVGSAVGACRFASPGPGAGSLEFRLRNESWSTYSELYTPDRGRRVAFLPFGLVAHESGRMYETWQVPSDEVLEIIHRSDRRYRYHWFETAQLFVYCRPGFPRPFYIARAGISPPDLFSSARSEGLHECSPTTVLRIAGGKIKLSGDSPPHLLTVDLTRVELNRPERTAIRDAEVIETLILAQANVSDVDLAYLTSLSGLTNLSLAGTSIGDEGLQFLVRLPLRILDLTATHVSDAGVTRLLEMESLEEVYLSRTLVSAPAIEGLRQSRPNLKVWT